MEGFHQGRSQCYGGMYAPVNIFTKADDLQNQAQPDFVFMCIFLRAAYEKSVVTVVGKTFDQMVSNCPNNVHLEVSKTKKPLC
ncbi:unnamed protein product [Brassica rapa]|uniref:Uncharacterized protein n=1 Tax=Brassica campestris TaxID=3711 RepID=A0A8D9HKY9_BRACM|nr:unnamed protein product [Brassica rapa]